MAYDLAPLDFESLVSSWTDLRDRLTWGSVFVLPWWLRAWWREFGSGARAYLRDVREDGNVIGMAPLKIARGRASFVGSADVCDYLDFAIAPGKELPFFDTLLDGLRDEGVSELYLESLRDDSTVFATLTEVATGRGYEVSRNLVDVSLDLELPSTWEEYLDMLTPKQRREVRRRLRRLYEAGDIDYRTFEDTESVQAVMDVFLRLFRDSKKEKAAFMTPRMESFFRSIAEAMAEAGLLRFGILELDALPVAAVMCFDHNNKVYLYHSGYDTQYRSLSVGLLSKALSIKDSIQRGRRQYDFLKGAEAYKYRLGGREIPVYNCRIALK